MPTMISLENSTHKLLRRIVLKEKLINSKVTNDSIVLKALKCLGAKK